MDRARAAGIDPHLVISHKAEKVIKPAPPPPPLERKLSSRRPSSVSLAIAKVSKGGEDGGLSIEFTTKQVRYSGCIQ